MTVLEFIKECQTVIAEYDEGKMTLIAAASLINTSHSEYPFEGPAHRMVYKIADLAFDISEDFRSENDNKADWILLTQTLERYVSGDWEPTSWILSAVYGEYEKDKVARSFGVSVRRQNGETSVDAAYPELKASVGQIVETTNTEQTDENYLRNLAMKLPEMVGERKLMSVDVGESLINPYYHIADNQ